MLRELAEALEVITVERPLVLVLEDLHWSDVSTLDWLSMLARRQERARLLIIGSYRPVEVLTRDHPLKGIKQELQLHGQCEELALDFLSEQHVEEYLGQRFDVGAHSRAPLQPLAHFVHRRTDGNPLFMVNVTNELVARKVIISHNDHWELQGKIEDDDIGVPENLRQLIAQQLTRVTPDERKVLETASVAGAGFSAATVAAGMEQSVEAVETHCDNLVRREQFLRTQGTSEWPDGTVAARYGFVHALYQEVVYEQLSASRRIRLHRQIGEREEQAYGDRAREIATELAVHFERGRDYRRAIQYLQHAGENALRRSANQEAINLLTKGLELLNTLPDTPERIQQELTLQIALGVSLTATKGWATPERERAYTRAQELCQQLGDTPQLFRVLQALIAFRLMRAELQTARELGEQCLTLAPHLHEPALLLRAYYSLGVTLLYLGELVPARAHLEQGIALSAEGPRRYDPRYVLATPVADCHSEGAMALWLLGYPDQALQRSYEGLTLAQESSHPFSVVLALQWTARLHRVRREGHAAQEQAEAQITLSAEHGFPNYLAWGTIERGWALAEQGQGEEGIAQICQGLAAQARRPAYLVILAAAYEKTGLAAEGIRVAAEALAMADKSGERFYDPELYRLKGELLLRQLKITEAKGKSQKSKIPSTQHLTPSTQAEAEAEACFLKAIDIARKQQAKSLELRATMSLARLWQSRGKVKQAHKVLSKIYHWFTEGFDTKDLQEAKALLEELR
jgi:tetratricopeptide (TPR) repeat protein